MMISNGVAMVKLIEIDTYLHPYIHTYFPSNHDVDVLLINVKVVSEILLFYLFFQWLYFDLVALILDFCTFITFDFFND